MQWHNCALVGESRPSSTLRPESHHVCVASQGRNGPRRPPSLFSATKMMPFAELRTIRRLIALHAENLVCATRHFAFPRTHAAAARGPF